MKKISVFLGAYLWTIFLCFSIFAQEFKTIQDGVEYAEMTRGTKEEPVRINLLRLDLTKVRLDVAHAMDAAIGLEKTSSIAARYGALAAINGGFFRLDRSIFAGDPTGVLKIDGKLLSEDYNGRIAFLIENKADKTEVYFEHLNLSATLSVGEQFLELSGINRERKQDELLVFTPEFNRTTLTNPNGLEVIVRQRKIVQVTDGKGSSLIPPDGFVLSASGKRREELLRYAKIKAEVEFFYHYAKFGDYLALKPKLSAPFPASEDITGGVPQLIKNGKIEITWQQEKSSKEFVETRHPRTAAAKLKDGKFLLVTVDGRQAGYSVGMNLNELAAFLLELGAQDAMNLDGGGSTTMFLDGKVANKPSDKEGERSVSDAILVFPRKKN
ncbi:MAG TPA: phosphodiester glycosidase family protein [Pyrinomonadaceae bacterium]|jgi:exopolysaccharide biosynthesis protein